MTRAEQREVWLQIAEELDMHGRLHESFLCDRVKDTPECKAELEFYLNGSFIVESKIPLEDRPDTSTDVSLRIWICLFLAYAP